MLDKLAANLPLTDGAETLVRVLKRLGYKIAVISGGFSRAAEALKRRLGVDYAYSNNLEVQGGKLTGRVVGPIVNAQRKAELLETIAQAEGVLLDQVIAVGDGANDALMLERAGLGIAFHAKPKLREAADTSISAAGLDAILYLLGLLRTGAARGGVRAAAATLGLALAAGARGDDDDGERGGRAPIPPRWPAAGGPPAGQPGVHLSWVRGEGAGVCPDAAAIEAEVAERLGGNPFARTPTQFIEAIVTQKAGGVSGHDRDARRRRQADRQPRAHQQPGRLPVDRHRGGADDRDPDRSRRAGARARAQAAAPPRPRPRRRRPRTSRVGGSPRSPARAGGRCRGVAPGGGLSATDRRVARRSRSASPAVVFPEQRTAAPDDGFAFGLTYGELVGCFVPLASASGVRWELCAGATAGILHAVVYAGTPTGPGQRWTFAAAQLTRVIIPVYQSLVAEIGLEATEPLSRREFFVAGRPAGMDTVFTQPVVTMAGWAGVGVRWK